MMMSEIGDMFLIPIKFLAEGTLITLRLVACCVVPSLRKKHKIRYLQKSNREDDGSALVVFWFLILAVVFSAWIFRILTWSWYAKLLLSIPCGILLAAFLMIVLGLTSEYWLWRIFFTGQEYSTMQGNENKELMERIRVSQERSERIKAIKPGDCFICRGTLFIGSIYGIVLERNESSVYAKCYSDACPTGESGLVRLDKIIEVISRSEFNRHTPI